MKTAPVAEVVTLYTAAALNNLGTLSGGGLQTATSGARWVLNQNAFSASDGTNTRVEMGNLTQNGISAAGWKFRANDNAGTPIFDSDGLIAVMKRIATAQVPSGNITTNAATQLVPNAVSYTLTRQQTVLVLGTLSASYTAANNHVAIIGLEPSAPSIGGGVPNPVSNISGTGTGANQLIIGQITLWQVKSLAASTYSAQFELNTAFANDTFSVNGGQIDIFLLGG